MKQSFLFTPWLCLPVVGIMVSCTVREPLEPRESVPRIRASRTISMSPPKEKASSWVQAQQMFEKSQDRPMLVGPHALRSWIGSPYLQIWNLCPETIRATYPAIPSAIIVSDLDEPLKAIPNSKSTIVLVGHEMGQDHLNSVWKRLTVQLDNKIMILSGGIEGWNNMIEPNP